MKRTQLSAVPETVEDLASDRGHSRGRRVDVRRAEQWISAAKGFVARSDFVPPTCCTHYGGILIAIGRWQEAERELLVAPRSFERGYRAGRMFPMLRLADLRARQ